MIDAPCPQLHSHHEPILGPSKPSIETRETLRFTGHLIRLMPGPLTDAKSTGRYQCSFGIRENRNKRIRASDGQTAEDYMRRGDLMYQMDGNRVRPKRRELCS